MRLKKIAHVTFDMRIGGAEQVIYNLVENTDRSQFRVSILCLNQPLGPFGVKLEKKGYEITCLDRTPGVDLSLIFRIRRHIVMHRLDWLHCHQYTPFFYGVLGSLFTPCRVMFTEHGRFFPDRRKFKRAMCNPLLSRFTDCITAISAATRDALVQFENFESNRIYVIYNGIDARAFREADSEDLKKVLGIPDCALVLGTVARLDPIKNHDMMINALVSVREIHPETYLIIVGDGPEKNNLEALARRLGLLRHVIFTGLRVDAWRFYRIMDVFLLTSFSEGTAMTLLEAMACNLPCVVSNVGGNPEIVEDGVTGFTIPCNDVEMLTEKVSLLLEDKIMRRVMGRAGRIRFEENFTVDRMVKAYEGLYDGSV